MVIKVEEDFYKTETKNKMKVVDKGVRSANRSMLLGKEGT